MTPEVKGLGSPLSTRSMGGACWRAAARPRAGGRCRRRRRDLPRRLPARRGDAGRRGGPSWLYGVARNVLLNQQRGERRRAQLGDRLRAELATASFPAPASETEMAIKGVLGEMEPIERKNSTSVLTTPPGGP